MKAPTNGVAGLPIQGFRRPDLFETPLAEHRHFVAQVEGILLFVGNDDRGDANPVDQRPEFTTGPLAERRIQIGKRLVQEQHAGLGSQRPREGDALLLSAGQSAHPPTLEPREIHQREGLGDSVARLESGHAERFQAERDVLPYIEMREERIMLKHHAEAALLGTERDDVLALNDDPSVIGTFEPAQQPKGRRLAAPTGAQQRQGPTSFE